MPFAMSPARRMTLCSTIAILATGLSAALAASDPVEVVGTYYRPDQDFPQFKAFWNEGAIEVDQEAAGDQADYVKPAKPKTPPGASAEGADAAKRPGAEGAEPVKMPLGGSLHLFLRNTGTTPAQVTDALLDGISLKDALAYSNQRKVRKFASIYFAKLSPSQMQTLLAAGEPVWWKMDPLEIAPGGVAEVIIRLRSQPKSTMTNVGVKLGSRTVEAQVPVNPQAPRLEGTSFGPDLQTVYLYFRHPGGAAPKSLTLDGRDITALCRIARDPAVSVVPVVARLPEPLRPASFHLFGGVYEDGTSVMSGLRTWSDEFVYGVFGGKPGDDNQREIGKQYLDDLAAHNVNLQMPQIGSGAVLSYFKSEQGRRHAKEIGLRFVLPDPGKFGVNDPFAIYVHDEPDCGDYRAEGLADNKKVGVLAQWCISHSDEIRALAPDLMHMLNLNMTYKPHNWHVYGQIPDIFTVDPYYQVRLKDVYTNRPERKPLYDKATYIYMVSSLAQSAASPNPVHVILYGNQQKGRPNRPGTFRFPTPPEKRIEVYYALAGGAKGLSYWWYTPGNPANGLGAATSGKREPAAEALWREVGLIGAEVRTAGPVLTTSCPVEIPAKASDGLWVRCLARGQDTLVMLVVNDRYTNTDNGTDIRPIAKAAVTVDLPDWLERPKTFEITPGGVKSVAARAADAGLHIPLGTVEVTRMLVITADPALESELQGYYKTTLAGATARLLK